MNVKEGVDLNGIRPEILRACADIHSLMEAQKNKIIHL